LPSQILHFAKIQKDGSQRLEVGSFSKCFKNFQLPTSIFQQFPIFVI